MSAKDPDETEAVSPDLALQRPGAPPSSDELPEGTSIDARYVVRRRIAAGGGGTVYVAELLAAPGQQVAIKVLLRALAASPLALTRFQREAEVVDRLHHPNIVQMLDAGRLPDGRPYIVMELVSTENLKTLVVRRGRLPPHEMLEILEATGSALAAAHAAGVIHRDLKASNISIGDRDGRPVIKLLDFGIAKLVQTDPAQPGLTVKGARLGTPFAMAPEQILGEPVDERADIYSLGVLIFQMLTGSYPFSGATPQEIERLHLEAIPPRPSQLAPVPAAVDAVVLRCLEKSPAGRFASVDQLLVALRTALLGDDGPGESLAPCPAVAIHVTLSAALLDEDQAAAALDAAEQRLRGAGFELCLLTGNAVLGVRVVAGDDGANRLARQGALDLARGLLALGGLDLRVHAGVALRRQGQVAGGEIVQIASWPATTVRHGVALTSAAARDLA